MSICFCSRALILPESSNTIFFFPSKRRLNPITCRGGGRRRGFSRVSIAIRASMVDSYESSSDFAKRMEQAWLIHQQPRPIACTSCHSNGFVECKWCGGTGFFILGDNMLCQVPSRNSSCVICAGKVMGLLAALIAKGQAFVLSGWENLSLPSKNGRFGDDFSVWLLHLGTNNCMYELFIFMSLRNLVV
ncbi:Tsi1-interacting protein TSIP1 [Cinnamomum micranthum f. kanehirae]|uniref:Tsi1-interacting protein TSIP1 n=1 Tax=Cinnamomum micranthum f. kanehirae TaxID=337451 RepID=A0A3S3N2Y5_9MAGN|nr:Tsi1-interacting protein TSIP1 [Cinnamomum micranthum f. kanehirae]